MCPSRKLDEIQQKENQNHRAPYQKKQWNMKLLVLSLKYVNSLVKGWYYSIYLSSL